MWYIILFFCICSTSSYSNFRQKIPNGDKVPNPCDSENVWGGVGHHNPSGGGSRNPFGQDFAQQGLKWTKELCNKDSDGDGKTNGQELGDPDCEWTEGATPKRTTDLSHPGVCEPVNSDLCKTKNAQFGNGFCTPEPECSGTKDTSVMNLTFIRTEIPSAVTNYFCQAFEINETIYAYATTMTVDNKEVMHHALLFGCKLKPHNSYFQSPNKCYMNSEDCNEIISLWSIGSPTDCLHDDLHFALGPGGSFQYVILQYHWNNPSQKKGMYDASTMNIYYSTTPRKYNGGIIKSGQLYLNLPPGQPTLTRTSANGPDCSRYVALEDSINISMSTIHMHGLGRSGSISQRRDGKFLRYLIPPQSYDYNNPKLIKPADRSTYEFLKGDEIHTECVFSTMDKNYTVYFGDGTDDEMCFGFFRIYPTENIRDKFIGFLNVGSIDACQIFLPNHGAINGHPGKYGNCNVTQFLNEVYKPHELKFYEFCKSFHSFCHHVCKEISQKFLDHPCWKGEQYVFMKSYDFFVYQQKTMRGIDMLLTQCRMEISIEKAVAKARKEYEKKIALLNGSSKSIQIIPMLYLCMIMLINSIN